MTYAMGSRQTGEQGPVSYLQSVSAGPARRWFAYPPATTHMFGTWNSWMWPRAKMGQTDTDGEKNSHWVTVRWLTPTEKKVRMCVCVFICVQVSDLFNFWQILTACQQRCSRNKDEKILTQQVSNSNWVRQFSSSWEESMNSAESEGIKWIPRVSFGPLPS